MLTIINSKHPEFAECSTRWDYLYRSYVGGTPYREGYYLHKYFGEELAPIDVYSKRLAATPLDNHMKTTVDVYRSFIFRKEPNRVFDTLASSDLVSEIKNDLDLQGQAVDSFMKTALDWALVLGRIWIGVDKIGERPYAVTYTPQMVPNWTFERDSSGKVRLTMIVLIEEIEGDRHTLKVWTEAEVAEVVAVWSKDRQEYTTIVSSNIVTNELGHVPFFDLTPRRNGFRAIPILEDVADQQKFIYNMLSEMEQNIRIASHPSLVKTADTKAEAGAGSIIEIPENLDPGLRPELLQPSGSTTDSIAAAIRIACDAIDRMTHLSAVRATAGSPMSGVAIQTERQLLNSLLIDLADTLEESEYKIWDLVFKWLDIATPEGFTLEYNRSFDIRDAGADIDVFSKAKSLVTNRKLHQEIDIAIAKMTIRDEEVLNDVIASIIDDYTKQPATGQTPNSGAIEE